MGMLSSRIDQEVLADALRDVLGEAAEQPLLEGPRSVAHRVRSLLVDPSRARRLPDAVTVRATERRSENEPPVGFGPVATDGGTYDDPSSMFVPAGSKEFDAAMDSVVHFDEQLERARPQVAQG